MFITNSAPCRLCGGNFGSGTDGAHELCKARAALGLPTPMLSIRCMACDGRGHTRKTPAPAVLNPSGETLKALFPPCPDCDGKGGWLLR